MHATRVLAACVTAAFIAACSHAEAPPRTWNPGAAAAYLDRRETWWTGWSEASRDHGTFCVSCHTVLPYALSRSALDEALDQPPSVNERTLLENVMARVRLSSAAAPYYSDQQYGAHKAAESRGTEAVLNALILTNDDARHGRFTDDARAALDHMWSLQQTEGDHAGAWPWLDFGLQPWEAKTSPSYGAALAALAAGATPQSYRSTPAVEQHLALLRDYVNREFATESLFNRTVFLWASTTLPDLLDPDRQRSVIAEILDAQRSDGGWSIASLIRTRRDATSDGYATGLVTFTLQRAGYNGMPVKRGLSWLVENQSRSEGLWRASSLNKRRNPRSNVGRFMSDASTAFAALALTEAAREARRDELTARHQPRR
jgi:squalene-hopene/tetraprenyl-beta-curcumene cyclase